MSFDMNAISSFNNYARDALYSGIQYRNGKDIKYAIEKNCLDKDGNIDLKKLKSFCAQFGIGEIKPEEKLEQYAERCFAGYQEKFGGSSVFKTCENIEKSGLDAPKSDKNSNEKGTNKVNKKTTNPIGLTQNRNNTGQYNRNELVGLDGYFNPDEHQFSMVA